MKIITQISMFDDTQNENLGDLERLQKVFDNLPDEKLIRKLKEKRGKGRNEWLVEAMWNSFIASFIFDHDSIASLLRELNRNSQLRIICGFQPHIYSVLTNKKDEYGKRISESRYKLAPTASAYTNFLNNLKECEQEVSNPHFKWGFIISPSRCYYWFRPRRDFAAPFLLVAS